MGVCVRLQNVIAQEDLLAGRLVTPEYFHFIKARTVEIFIDQNPEAVVFLTFLLYGSHLPQDRLRRVFPRDPEVEIVLALFCGQFERHARIKQYLFASG